MDLLNFLSENSEFVIKAMEFLSWPVTILIVVIIFKASISKLLDRLSSAELGGSKFTFADASKRLMEGVTSEEKEKLTRDQIISESMVNGVGFRLYSNGLLVQKTRLVLRAGTSNFQLTYPCVFPNEVLNIQFVGSVNAIVTNVRVGGFDFSFEPASSDRTIEVIASGV